MKLTTKGIDLLAELAKASARLLISKKEAVLFRSRESGIMPLLEALKSLSSPTLQGAIVADAVVGKARCGGIHETEAAISSTHTG